MKFNYAKITLSLVLFLAAATLPAQSGTVHIFLPTQQEVLYVGASNYNVSEFGTITFTTAAGVPMAYFMGEWVASFWSPDSAAGDR